MQNPDLFTALVPINGGVPLPYARRIKHVPTWAFHGKLDPMIPVEESQRMIDALREPGGNARLTIYPEAKHDARTQAYGDQACSASCVCAPARAALLTGRYPHRTGVVTLNMNKFPKLTRLHKDETTIADLMSKADYVPRFLEVPGAFVPLCAEWTATFLNAMFLSPLWEGESRERKIRRCLVALIVRRRLLLLERVPE